MRVRIAAAFAALLIAGGIAIAVASPGARVARHAGPPAAQPPPAAPPPATPPSATRSSARALPAPATAAFGLDLLHALGPTGNTVLSPDSVATALAMTGTGAAGRTAAQIATALHLRSPSAFAAVGRLQQTLLAEQAADGRGDSEAPQLDIANGLFLQQGYPLEQAFATGLQSSFGAAPQAVDFSGANAAALAAINNWVSSHTAGKIPHILSSVDPMTRLALANAVYLKARWASPFAPGATAPASFHGASATTRVPFMHQTETLAYGHGPGYAAVQLPYRSSTLSLLVVLPSAAGGVTSFARALTAPALARIVASLRSRPVALSLPRFHISLQTQLNGLLRRLGIIDAFDSAANFSGITRAERLQIGLVEHAADFAVDEQGTVATAATVVTIEPTAVLAPPRNPVRFDADHPFLFFLRDQKTGAVLFAG